MKSTPFNGRYGLGQAQQRSVAHHEDIEANYAYLETQDSDLYKDKLNYYLNVLKRRKWYAIFTSFIIIPIIAINMISEEKIYESSTRLLIEDDNPQILNIKEITTPDKSTNFFQTEYQLIRTKENIEEVVNTLQLDKEVPSKKPTFLTHMKEFIHLPSKIFSDILSFFKNKLLSAATPISENSVATSLSPADLSPAEGRRRQAVARVYGSLTVAPQKDTKLVDIRISGPDPQLVAQQANTLAEIYIRKNLEKKLEVNRNAQVWLIDQTEDLKKQMHEAELKLQRLRDGKKFVSLDTDERRGLIVTAIDKMTTEYNETHNNRISIESRL